MATIAKFANHIGYSDVDPFEVVRVVNDKTVDVRAMTATPAHTTDDLGFQSGGFVGHCSRQDKQQWDIATDATAPITRIRLGKSGWRDAHGRKYQMADAPRKFYDYNF